MAVEMEKRLKMNSSSNYGGSAAVASSPICGLDDGCLMHIFSFLSPIPGAVVIRFPEAVYSLCDRASKIGINTALVCHRWRNLACHPRLWLRVDGSMKNLAESAVFPDLETAVSAARPGDTILIASGGNHVASSIQIKKPLCLVGGGELPDDTILTCSRGSESAIEFLSTCKVANLTVRAELGCCFLHRSGRLTIERCVLQCEENPLDYLSCPIVSTANGCDTLTSAIEGHGDSVTVSRTRIEGGSKAVKTSGGLVLQHVRAIYSRRAIFFWFQVSEQKKCV